jgi:hypothetical protein
MVDETPSPVGEVKEKELKNGSETPQISLGDIGLQISTEKVGLEDQHIPKNAPGDGFPKDWRFWVIFAALGFTSLLTAIESTVTSTALPTIARDLNAQETYVWFVNSFFLTR